MFVFSCYIYFMKCFFNVMKFNLRAKLQSCIINTTKTIIITEY